MGFWGWFYVVLVVFTVGHSVYPENPKSEAHHVEGARIITIQWLCSFIVTRMTGDLTPIEFYSIIDAVSAFLFLQIAVKNKALWAAYCVILHTSMSLLHVSLFITGEAFETAYQWILNTMFLAVLIIINTAIFAGRRAHVMDDYRLPVAGGWRWSFVGALSGRREIDLRV